MKWIEIKDKIEPEWYSYEGNAEKCIWDFYIALPEQIIRDSAVNAMIQKETAELLKEGATLLRTQVFCDYTSSTWNTYYRVIAWSTASPIAWSVVIGLAFTALIAAALVAAAYFVLQGIKSVQPIFLKYGKEAFGALMWTAIAAMVVGGLLFTWGILKRPERVSKFREALMGKGGKK